MFKLFSKLMKWLGSWPSIAHTPACQDIRDSKRMAIQPTSPPPPRKRIDLGSSMVQSSSNGSDDGFIQSMVLGASLDNGILGGVIGGNMVGGLIGGAIADHNEPQASQPPEPDVRSYEPPPSSPIETPSSSYDSGSSSSYVAAIPKALVVRVNNQVVFGESDVIYAVELWSGSTKVKEWEAIGSGMYLNQSSMSKFIDSKTLQEVRIVGGALVITRISE